MVEGAVCGRPDPRWGEVPVAVIYPEEDSGLTEEELRAFLEPRISAFNAGHSIHQSSANLVQISADPLIVPRLMSLSKRSQSRSLFNIVAGLSLSVLLMAGAILGLMAPAVASVGFSISWLLSARLVRLGK